MPSLRPAHNNKSGYGPKLLKPWENNLNNVEVLKPGEILNCNVDCQVGLGDA